MKIEMASLDWEGQHDLMRSSIAPRPIALISTIGEDGIYNAAPFSAVNVVCQKPPIVCVSFTLKGGQKKDTSRNIGFSGDFVINIMDETMIRPAIQTSADYPSDADEIREVGLTAVPADRVKSPRIAEAQVSLECRLVQRLELGEGRHLRDVVFGEVVLAHVKDELMVDGRIESSRMRTVGCIGKDLYCRTSDMFEMRIQ